MSARRLVCVAVALCSPALASDPVVRFRVEYRAPAECPDARAFVAGVTGRTKQAAIAAGADARAVEVVIESAPALEGRVRLSGSDREPVERSVRGADCNEIVDALALITALSFDPEASSDVTPDEAPPSPAVPAPKPLDTSRTWSLHGGLALVPLQSTLPGSSLGFAASVGASSEGELFAPLLLLTARRLAGDTTKLEGRAEFSITSVGAVVCPVRHPERGALALRPCAGFDLGQLSAEGVNLTDGRRSSSVWLSPTLGARGTWSLAEPLLVGAGVDAGFPLKRQRFTFDSGERVHDIPRVSFGFWLELGVELR